MIKFLPKDIGLIVYDFDGVMTDNKVILSEDGIESVIVNRSDGLAVETIKNNGIRQIILSKEKNKVVINRAKKLNIEVLHGIDNKKDILGRFCNDHSILLKNVVFVGNDINDLDAMKTVGYPMCPQDAYPEVRAIAKFVIPVKGGDGVVRELLNYMKLAMEGDEEAEHE
ncbi:MAG TPA: KdsC family phosphatase [Candidatus Wunengus sp. YC65]|uniref:KdsC family phosphatase n=1 Tax=Candidatus Wunengus sp. YC65 TaxID=3367701 RepID=UPI0040259281